MHFLLIFSNFLNSSFFFCYQPIKKFADEYTDDQALSVLVASIVSSVPSSLVYVPADVVKKRVVLGVNTNATEALKSILKEKGFKGLFLGWQANLVKDVPFAGNLV